MMVVNLANAIKLRGDATKAKELLEKEDWSAASQEFQICVGAVRDDVEEVCKLMRQAGGDGPVSSSDFRDWPVFRGIRNDPAFASAFEEVFGEPLLLETSVGMEPSSGVGSLTGEVEQSDVGGPSDGEGETAKKEEVAPKERLH